MAIRRRCPNCQKLVQAPNKFSGQIIACPSCGNKVKLPTLESDNRVLNSKISFSKESENIKYSEGGQGEQLIDQPDYIAGNLDYVDMGIRGTFDNDNETAIKTVAILFLIPTVIFALYTTFIAFNGGIIPILNIKLTGGFLSGLLWIFIADPIIYYAGYYSSLLVAILIFASSKGSR